MPKDYQEEDLAKMIDLYGTFCADPSKGNPELQAEMIMTTLTTYGNARELEGVENVEKGVPIKSEPRGAWESGEVMGWNDCRQATLDHITKIKTELSAKQ